jgi:hypothetical protein
MAPPFKFDHDRAIMLYARGMTYLSVSESLGVSPSAVRSAIQKAGHAGDPRLATRFSFCPQRGRRYGVPPPDEKPQAPPPRLLVPELGIRVLPGPVSLSGGLGA